MGPSASSWPVCAAMHAHARTRSPLWLLLPLLADRVAAVLEGIAEVSDVDYKAADIALDPQGNMIYGSNRLSSNYWWAGNESDLVTLWRAGMTHGKVELMNFMAESLQSRWASTQGVTGEVAGEVLTMSLWTRSGGRSTGPQQIGNPSCALT